jgi:all-trans-retinol 13,14-reductase
LEIVKPIVRQILALGGTVLVRAPVSEIMVNDKGEAIGVVCKGQEILASTVISTAGAINTFLKLIPSEKRHFVQNQVQFVEKQIPTTSFCSLFVGIDNADGKDLQLPKQNFWVFPSWDHEDNNMKAENDFYAPLPGAFISFPSAKDSTYKARHPGKEVAVLVAMTVRLDRFLHYWYYQNLIMSYAQEYKYYEFFRDLRVKKRGEVFIDNQKF